MRISVLEQGKVFLGGSGKAEYLLLPYANRHGLVTNPVAGGVAAEIGRQVGGSVGRAIVRGMLGGILRR